MTLKSDGLTDIGLGAGVTANFQIQYNDELGNTRRLIENANALLEVVEAEFAVTTAWFKTPGGKFGPGNRQIVNLDLPDSRGGVNSGYGSAISINAQSGNDNAADAAAVVRMLFMNEWAEILMSLSAAKWNRRDSCGEALSQYCGIERFPAGHYSFYGSWVNDWLTTLPRQDWVNKTEPTDTNKISYGCALAFLYYLNVELNYNITDIIAAGAPTLAGVYRNLTGDTTPPDEFFALMNSYFPGRATVGGSKPDCPFPLRPRRSGIGSTFCVCLASDNVEVFWIRGDGMVFSNARVPGLNSGKWNNPINEVAPLAGSADPRSGVASVSPSPGAVEVFWIRGDGMVFSNARVPGLNGGKWNSPINEVAPLPGSADPRSGVAAVSPSPGAIEVFWIRPDGMVFSNALVPGFNSGKWNRPINEVAPLPGSADPRSGVAAVSPSPGAVEVFWIRGDGMLFSNARVPGLNSGKWNNPIVLGTGADPHSGVAAVSRQYGGVDVFWVGADGTMMTCSRNPLANGGRFSSPLQIAAPGSVFGSSPVGAVSSSLNAVEVFWVRSDGMVFTNAQNPFINNDRWNNPINDVAPLPGSAATVKR